jgi:NADH dehydrogenase FAD-containing subunit
VNVNEFLQASDSIFAIGDCNNVSEPKLYVTCGTKKVMFGLPVGHADIVAKNLVSLVAGKPLTPYKPKSNTAKPQMLLPIGPTDAVSINAPGFFGKMKAKDYFYPGQWKFSGLQPPRKPLAS